MKDRTGQNTTPEERSLKNLKAKAKRDKAKVAVAVLEKLGVPI
jgi:hypothetical protein